MKRDLAAIADPKRADSLSWFFKTGKGQYGEGDRFLGITVPQQSKVAVKYRDLPLQEVARLLKSPFHEHRSVGLAILVLQFTRGTAESRHRIFDFYLAHAQRVNNWDLVDGSAPYIVGRYLNDKSRDILYQLARSPNLWERRIAIVSTLSFVKAGELDDAFGISQMLLGDKHDLIHKAVGWVLRECGKISRSRQLEFITSHYGQLPRTALRYAIEHLPPLERKQVLAGDMTGVGGTSNNRKSPSRLNRNRALRGERKESD
ncbi:MAG: DNA alkylation repair protein [Bryobacteraceae bacterium]